MTAISKITCDGCGADLTAVTDRQRWRITATAGPVPGGLRAAPPVRGKPLSEPKHFCDIKCMGRWSAQETDQCGS